MYESLGICLGLAALLSINALTSLIVSAGSPLFRRLLQKSSARTRADVLFTLRVAPPCVALISIGLLVAPAYLRYEPYSTAEVVSGKLATLAFLSALGISFALWRGFRSWKATRSLLRNWLAGAEPISLSGVKIRTFRIPHVFPIIAVVGTIRPCLFIAQHVLESLTEAELSAAIAHEGGHLEARDNLKRSMLRVCRDVLMIFPSGRSLDRAWAEAAEAAADEHAARNGPELALNLASALVKIARMIPQGGRATIPMAAFLVGDEGRGVKARVRHLLEMATTDCRLPARRSKLIAILPVAAFLLLALTVVLASSSPVLLKVHVLIEQAVELLS